MPAGSVAGFELAGDHHNIADFGCFFNTDMAVAGDDLAGDIGFRVLCNKVKYKNATIRSLTSPNCYILLIFKLQNDTFCCFLAHQKRRTPPELSCLLRP